jgi:phosphohistidine phosphatase
MNLILIRHGRAGNPAEFARGGMSDDLRPLTVEGRKRMRQNIDGLARLLPRIDTLATSPLVRAVETAQIVAKAFKVSPVEVAALSPGGKRDKLVAWLIQQPAAVTVAMVGHEPVLSNLAVALIGGSGGINLSLKKGGACCVQFKTKATLGSGELLWLLTPRQLRLMR